MDHWRLKNVTRKNWSEQEDLWKHRKSGCGHGQTADKFPGTFVRCLDPVLCMSLRILSFSIMFSVRIPSRFLVKHCPLSIHPAAGQGRGKAVRTFDVLVRRRLLKNATPQFWELKDLWKNWKIFLGCLKVRIKLGLILISIEYTAKYHVNYVVTMRYEKIITNK